jgi:GDP-4-dehydro-6-deoxy-D-mannose reductase
METKTALITGVTGFVGRHLVKAIREELPHARIIGASRRAAPVGCPVEVTDFCSAEAVLTLVDAIRPDYIFHLIAAPAEENWDGQYTATVAPSLYLLEAVRSQGLETRVVQIGSAAEYGRIEESALPVREDCELNPLTPYGVAKAWQTMAAKYYATRGVHVVVARMFNLLGPGVPEFLAVGTFASQLYRLVGLEAPRRLLAGNLDVRRDYIDVRDACRALIALASHGESGQVYNVCSGRSVLMRDLLSRMIAQTGLAIEVVTEPARVRSNDQPEVYGSYARLAAISGWQPTIDLDKSIVAMMQLASQPAHSVGDLS